MTDQDKAVPDRRSARSLRKSPEIELKATEATVVPEPPLVTEPAAAAGGDIPPEATIESMEKSAEPDIITSPQQPAPRQQLAGPMAIAAIIGGLLGTTGGAFLPSIMGAGKSSTTSDIQKLQQTVASLATRPATGAAPADTQALQGRMTGLENDLAKRVGEAEKRLADRIGIVETGVKAVESRSAAGPAAALPPVDVGPLLQRLEVLEQAVNRVDSKADASAKAAEPRLAALSERMEAASRRLEAGTAAPLFTAVQALAQAFNRGGAYSTELTAIELLGGKADQLAPLKPFAEKGAPTLPQLAAAFAPLAGPIARSGEAPADGVMAYLQRFVKMRPVGEIGGNSPPDIVRTIETALGRGNTAEALTAWAKLPEATRAASATWATMAGDRDNAAKALKSLQDSALTALRTAKP